jgi:sugar phosphate isomerase/epimerase
VPKQNTILPPLRFNCTENLAMKLGLQTLPWLNSIEDVQRLFSDIYNLGYEGVELAQTFETKDHRRVIDALKRTGLKLAGISGGALSDRLDFAISLHNKFQDPFYLYADEWSGREHTQFKQSGVSCSVAIHPHMFKPIQTVAEAKKVIELYPYMKFLPDTGHLTVAGENIMEVLEANFATITAIHVKDWTPEFGRALPFYSSGFVTLGEGIVPIEEIIQYLVKVGYKGWLIVEQDFSIDPIETARQSRIFLKKLGI